MLAEALRATPSSASLAATASSVEQVRQGRRGGHRVSGWRHSIDGETLRKSCCGDYLSGKGTCPADLKLDPLQARARPMTLQNLALAAFLADLRADQHRRRLRSEALAAPGGGDQRPADLRGEVQGRPALDRIGERWGELTDKKPAGSPPRARRRSEAAVTRSFARPPESGAGARPSSRRHRRARTERRLSRRSAAAS